jgi:hypothetical protein
MILKKKDNTKNDREPKLRVYHVNTHKRAVIALWILLAASLLFAVYKNFTAVDVHTVHETKVVEEKVLDTHKVENFVTDFVKTYYAWEQNKASIEKRTKDLQRFLTGDLQALNADTVRADVPVSSQVTNVQIWEVAQKDEHICSVTYTVDQKITENGSSKTVQSAYEVLVYVDDAGNLVLTKNPTITSIPKKSGYKPKVVENDGTVDSVATEEISSFLTTFFTLYPSATEKELSYYVNDGILKPVGKNYRFSELVDPVYNRDGNQVRAVFTVKYLDDATKMTQVSQYDLMLEKADGNWKIVR